MCILLPHNLIRTSNSIFFVPFTDCPPRPCPPWQLLDVLRGFPHLQRHLCYLQQPRQSLRSDGKAALRPYILPHLPAHTSCGSSTQVWALGQCPIKFPVSPKSPQPKGIVALLTSVKGCLAKSTWGERGLSWLSVWRASLSWQPVTVHRSSESRDMNAGAQLTFSA